MKKAAEAGFKIELPRRTFLQMAVCAAALLFDIVRCKARALAEQMDDPEAKRTILKNADGYEQLAEGAEERAAGRWPHSK
jgi:hypothetical protein